MSIDLKKLAQTASKIAKADEVHKVDEFMYVWCCQTPLTLAMIAKIVPVLTTIVENDVGNKLKVQHHRHTVGTGQYVCEVVWYVPGDDKETFAIVFEVNTANNGNWDWSLIQLTGNNDYVTKSPNF